MKITKYDPFKEIEKFLQDEDFFGFVPAMKRSLMPPMDVYQTDTHVVVEMQVPKVDPSKIHVSVEDGVLRIEGEEVQEKENEGKDYYRKEIRAGNFARAIALPVPIKEDEIDATYEGGLLKVSMMKTEVKKPKKVEVKIK